MHPTLAALGLAAILVAAGGGLALVSSAPDAPAQHAHAARGGEDGHAGAHAWPSGAGRVPGAADTQQMGRLGRIVIAGDEGWNPANGVRSGSGTFEDPYVISGWHVDQVYIRDTDKAFVIRENYVADILILDWTGAGGHVHHNHVANLRTNRNVERTGDPTAALIEHNRILRVEELRHFDGVLANNTIGAPSLLDPLGVRAGRVVLNIAGLNGAGIRDNEIFGGVDMKLHGHHHGDAPGAHSHNHGAPDAAHPDGPHAARATEDHQVRHVDFRFANNTLRDVGFGLRYNDLDHAADDRQATSEQEPELEKPHVHHTRVAIVGNLIEGATLRVSVLNAQDERHLPGESAELVLADNRIQKPRAGDGILVQDVRNARVLVEGNRVEKPEGLLGLGILGGEGAAIMLLRFENASIVVAENWMAPYRYGIRAAHFDALTTWSVVRNQAPGVEHPVFWDDSVPNAPTREEGDAHEGHAHSHAPPRSDALAVDALAGHAAKRARDAKLAAP